jgi:hypothetical protein
MDNIEGWDMALKAHKHLLAPSIDAVVMMLKDAEYKKKRKSQTGIELSCPALTIGTQKDYADIRLLKICYKDAGVKHRRVESSISDEFKYMLGLCSYSRKDMFVLSHESLNNAMRASEGNTLLFHYLGNKATKHKNGDNLREVSDMPMILIPGCEDSALYEQFETGYKVTRYFRTHGLLGLYHTKQWLAPSALALCQTKSF